MEINKIKYKGLNGIPLNKTPANTNTNDMSGWRIERPVIDHEKCVGCKRCFVFCPDVAIYWDEVNFAIINYHNCKGCGICAQECKVKAIKMVRE